MGGTTRTGEVAQKTVFSILFAISFSHLLNDMVQSLIPSIYPILKSSYNLNFSQLGLLTLTYQLTASLFQPFIGLYTDRRPQPYSLPIGVTFTFAGVILLALATSFEVLLVAAALVGLGSAVFHPESSRVARMASGGQHGLAQSVFQLGGTFGAALGPLLAAFLVLPRGQHSLAWFSLTTLISVFVLAKVARWYKRHQSAKAVTHAEETHPHAVLPRQTIALSLAVLIALIFSKYFYLASLSSYYTFYLMSKFHVSIQSAQLYLFLFLGSAALGTLIGGPIGDRIGRKYVIWVSIVGVLPFTLALPYANLLWTSILSVIIALVLSSAFSAILVYAQELLPGKVGMISGLFFGLAFGMGGIGAAFLGALADHTSIEFVYKVCAYLPAIGLLTGLLPNIDGRGGRRGQSAETVSPAILDSSGLAESPGYLAK
ncbi:MAG: MFS transporter [Acidobacteriota bacterium]|nr:MFS transporter [Acidobacteriota bacterium]